MLLGQAAELKDKRLLIVGEGMLQYIPFAALPNPSVPSSPLIVTNEIVTLPSASVLAELMRRFYDGMLVKGLRPAAALRAAQVSMWRERRWAAPQYWAAFTLEGE